MTMTYGFPSGGSSTNARDGAVGYRCRCGVTHFGAYAYEDWRHHSCLHAATLLLTAVPGEDGPMQALCSDCGNAWTLTE